MNVNLFISEIEYRVLLKNNLDEPTYRFFKCIRRIIFLVIIVINIYKLLLTLDSIHIFYYYRNNYEIESVISRFLKLEYL